MSKKKERVTITLSPNVHKKLRDEAEKRGLAMSTIVTLALEEYERKEAI